MAAITRPGTPFPHHSHSGSPSSPKSYFSHPLHFAVPALPARTPASLLNRSPSASSSSSRRTPLSPSQRPAFEASRRASHISSCSSTSSPTLPATPVLESTFDISILTALELPEASELSYRTHPKADLSLPEPSYNWTLKAGIHAPIFSPFSASAVSPSDYLCSPLALERAMQVQSTATKAVRPKLTRRDTPRPVRAVVQPMSCPFDSTFSAKRKFTSMVSGDK